MLKELDPAPLVEYTSNPASATVPLVPPVTLIG